jgi:hypothetical protein
MLKRTLRGILLPSNLIRLQMALSLKTLCHINLVLIEDLRILLRNYDYCIFMCGAVLCTQAFCQLCSLV